MNDAVLITISGFFITILLLFVIGVLYARKTHLEKRVNFDHLTRLPNRAFFYNDIHDRVNDARKKPNTCVNVLLMDLNKFKQVNDTLGHPVGDQLLILAAQRLTHALRGDDIVARLGGDEFAVILSDNTCRDKIDLICKRILVEFKKPFNLENVDLSVGISIGVASFPKDGATVDEIVRCADIAMYVAKKSNDGFAFYDENLDENSIENLSLPNDLKTAIQKNQLKLYYLPKKCLRTNKIIGIESLLRWEHPKYGTLLPDKFLGVARDAGYLYNLTQWVLNKTVKDLSILKSEGIDITASINITAQDLAQPSILLYITERMFSNSIRPKSIILEVTEFSIMSNPEEFIKVLVCLSSLGIQLSIDDFSRGSSSFMYLRHLPVSEIKIDRGFIRDLTDESKNNNILKSTIDLAHNIGCKVVASGVESYKTESILKEFDCDMAQGFNISKPLEIEYVTKFIKNYNGVINDDVI